MNLYKVHLTSIFVICLLFFSCKKNTTGKNAQELLKPSEDSNQIQCLTNRDRIEVLSKIIGQTQFQIHLHPEVEERLPIQIKKTKFFDSNLAVIANGHEVVFKDSLELPYGKVHQIDIMDLDCNLKSMRFYVFYPIEGWFMAGSAKLINDEWQVYMTSSGNID